MPLDINQQFDLHTRVLGLANQRLELLADNIANADTPNYKARDLDFRAAMANANGNGFGGELPLASTGAPPRPGHIRLEGDSPNTTTPLYRVPEQPSLDGNTVDSQKENAAVAETSVRYQATLTFLSSRIRGLRDAITGGR
ncbi:MAG: flagellar basal body rod protein FlgB [Gammaproteobacteria bacterium]|nr:flagellar basal body rod protein FlgB [Gammaproteobacteria bacterium]